MIDKEIHEDENVLWVGIRIMSYLYFLAKEYGAKYGLKFTIEESPAESASRRLAKIDQYNYGDKAIVRGDGDQIYYTNSIHIRPDADVDILTRIMYQSKFHKIIESGAIIHAFVGEKIPSKSSIANLVQKTFEKTDAAQLTISPEFTVCKKCGKSIVGLSDSCNNCGSSNVYGVEFGKFTEAMSNWDKKLLGK
jgi:ribonucleoside-triphosphate reductase